MKIGIFFGYIQCFFRNVNTADLGIWEYFCQRNTDTAAPCPYIQNF